MKNLFLIFALLFFAPTPNFAVTASIHQTEVIKKPEQKKISQNLTLGYIFGAIGIGAYLGALASSAVPVLALIAYVVSLVFCILAIIFLIKGLTEMTK